MSEFREADARLGAMHGYEPMHHYGPDGRDYGPTGYEMCPCCGDIRSDENASGATVDSAC